MYCKIGLRALLALALIVCEAEAQAPAEGRGESPQAAPPQKTQSKKTKASRAATQTETALPCARARWKDDPVCFGENDPAALPLPSAGSGGSKDGAAKRNNEDVTITPKAGVNNRAGEPIYGNNPNPRPSDTNFGGGVGVNFNF
jgi:hypothetical protein